MIKFSMVVPVYNTYDYLRKCLDSLVKQKNVQESFEVVIVNDGTPDNSEEIILEYKEKYPNLIKYIKKENGGLSSARNEGVKHCEGEYILFIDSDDYLDLELLSKLETHIKVNNTPDLIRMNSRDVKTNGEVIKDVVIDETDNTVQLIKNLMNKQALEIPWGYVYNTKFYKDNNFTYAPRIHEDYGLTPIIIYKAKTMTYLNFIGYNYVEREGSIMAETQYEKLKKRVDDMFAQYLTHMQVIQKDSVKGNLLRSYSLEAMLNKLIVLNKKDMNDKLAEIKNEISISDVYCYNFKKIFKKILLMINIKLYLNLYKKFKNVGE